MLKVRKNVAVSGYSVFKTLYRPEYKVQHKLGHFNTLCQIKLIKVFFHKN